MHVHIKRLVGRGLMENVWRLRLKTQIRSLQLIIIIIIIIIIIHLYSAKYHLMCSNAQLH